MESAEFVISGMSCRLPKSDSVAEFQENLFGGVDMLDSDIVRYNSDFYGLPKSYGKCKNITKFDANFFGINSKQAAVTDPQVRLLLETTYEALIDAGFRSEELSGSNTGVFVGSCESDAARIFTRYVETIEGYVVTGCSRSMFANRISFTFNFKGPSYVTDTACSSSLVAFHMALQSLRSNECDMALVLGANLCLIPEVPLQLFRIGMLGKEGVCRAFDAKGEGYVRSDGIVALVLQRRTDARRIYAEIINTKTSTDGFKEEGITFPSGEEQAKLLKAIYKEAKLDPLAVSYVEAHGTGTPVGDPQELQAISSVLCKGRQSPLLVGSVKSNMGHAEPASGAAGLVKVLLSIKKEMLPANLNFEDPNPDIPSLTHNEIKVVAENTPWRGEFVGINSFGFGGSNVHVILRKPKEIQKPTEATDIRYPILLLSSGRTASAVSKTFELADEHNRDPNLMKLLNQVANVSTRRNHFRGYKILHSQDSVEEKPMVTKVTPKKQLWYIFTGMGAQWFGMGESLLKLPPFEQSISESAEAIKPLGINLLMMIHRKDQNGNQTQGLNNIMEVFVLLIAVQVGIVDLLAHYGIEPAGIIGHSVGEIVAAYADGAITRCQAVQIAYYRAKAIMDGKIATGKMLAVGMTDADCQEILKPFEGEVVIACQNTKDALTLSGPADKIDQVAEILAEKNIFAKAVDTFGIAFHSPLMSGVAEDFRKNIEKVITQPKMSSGKWISTSITGANVDSFPVDSEYFVNNLVATVQFHSALKAIPEQSLVIEIGPNGILQTVIKRGLPSNCAVLDSMRSNEDDSDYLLTKVGEIFTSGIEMQPAKIFDGLSYPVPLATAMLNSSLEWDHSVDWPLEYEPLRRFYSRIAVEPMSMDGREESTYVDHVIDGRNLFPLTGYLYHAWKQSCYIEKLPMDETSVIIENLTVLEPIEFHKAKTARKVAFGQNQTEESGHTSKGNDAAKNDLLFNYNPFSGEFAFADADTLYCTGKVTLGKTAPAFKQEPIEETSLQLSHEDIYREFMLRGYDYGPQFQGIYKADLIGKQALLKWNGYWSSFLDAVTQLGLLLYKGETLFFAHHIDYCAIDPVKHRSSIMESDGQKLIGVSKIPWEDGWAAGGVLIKNAHGRTAPRTVDENVTLMDVQFVPYEDDKCLSRCVDPLEVITESNEELEERLKCLIKQGYFAIPKTIPMVLSLLEGDDKSHQQMLGSAVSYFQDVMESDSVFNRLWNENTLKPMFDVVVNNVHHHRLEICFYHPPSVECVKLVDKLVGFYPFMQSNITVVSDRQLDLAGLKSAKLIVSSFGDLIPEALKFDMLIFKNSLLCLRENHMLEMVSRSLKPEGFALVQEVTEEFLSHLYTNDRINTDSKATQSYWQEIFTKNHLDLQAYHHDSLPLALMLLQPVKPIRKHIFVDAEDLENFAWVDELKVQLDQISGQQADHNVWLTSLKPQVNGIAGLLNSLKEDYPDYHIKYLYNADFKEKKLFKTDSEEINDRCTRGLIANVYQNGKWGFFTQIHTQLKDEETLGETTQAVATTLGIRNLSALEWVEGSSHNFLHMENLFYNLNRSAKAQEICNVYYAALNFKDVMVATGRLPIADCYVESDALGFEFAGRTSNGRRVMGIVTSGAVGTQVRAEQQYLMEVPNSWSLEEAATTPVVYTTAYYALIVKGNMKSGEKVLIHAGSGGVGLAAIAIALAHKCVVYTTVSTAEKRQFVQELFPSLEDWQFLNSRSTDFLAEILRLTNGQGVDVVLNSLAEDKLLAGVECVAKDGRFLEIGKYDMSRNSALGMKCFLKNISFVSVVGERMFQEDNGDWPTVLELFEKGVADGTVKPLPRNVFEKENVSEAIRDMAAGKHKGKVLIKMKEEEKVAVDSYSPATVMARRRIQIAPDEVIVVTGGLGGLGLEVAQLLIRRGAKRLILTSRRGITTSYQRRTIEFWQQRGVTIEVSTLDVSYLDQTTQLVSLAQSMGSFVGVFHLAVKSAAQDVIFDNETSETFNSAVGGKFTGAFNLDLATRKVPKLKLKWFVMFSSVSASFQYLALGNYSWANSALDNLVRERRANGLCGNSIEWGPVGDVGILYNLNKDNNFNFFGLLPQRLNSVLDWLDRLLMADRPCVISCVRSDDANTVGGSKAKRSITDAISAILGLTSGEAMDPNTPFEVYGIDSLIGVELRQVLERDYGIIKSVKELKKMTPMELQALIQE